MRTSQPLLRRILEHPVAFARAAGFDRLTDLHDGWMRDMLTGQGDMTLLAHRGSYKTTCLSVAIALLIALRPTRNILFLRKTDSDVTEIVTQVRRVLEGEPMRLLTTALTGVPVQIVRSNAVEITTSYAQGARGAVQLLGVGTSGSITGKHADIVITDDIVNARDRVSRAERERTKLLYMELQNIRNRGGRIINAGTPWHKDDAISVMPNVRRFDCYQTGLIDRATLDELRRSMSPSLFAANYELLHIAAEDALFMDAPRFTTDAELLRDGVAHVDASYGGEDGTAFTCGKRDGDTLYMYGRLWRGHVDQRAQEIATECARLRCAPLWMENNADKGYLRQDFTRRGVAARGYHETLNKYVKISTYLRKWWANIVWLEGTDAEYLAQVLDYTEDAAHDDAPDSAACVARLLDRERRRSLI